MVLANIYVGIRTWYWVREPFRWTRFNSYLIISHAFLYYLSRQVSSAERKRFEGSMIQS